jgi:phospholipid transport system substrate-binding protein
VSKKSERRKTETAMKKRTIGSVVFLAFLLMLPFQAHAVTPLETIKAQVNRVLEVLRDPSYKGESGKKAQEAKIWTIADQIFSFSELSRRSVGQNWRKFTPDQQKEFTGLFRRLLGNLYLSKIMAYTDEKVVFENETMFSSTQAEVKSKVISASNEIPINYRMILRNGQWRVYDVVVEGVGLVQNYRSQFREILMNKTPQQLIQILRKKVEGK